VITPLRIYGAALRRAAAGDGGRIYLIDEAGHAVARIDSTDWTEGLRSGDLGMLERCGDATLDVGCGPGRLALALTRTGRAALGIDISAEAVRQARRRGVNAVRVDVFAPVPREGDWGSILLADGSIGIGGDPHRLLRRCAGLLRSGGTILAEVHPPGQGTWTARVRLRHGGMVSSTFPWAAVAADDLASVGGRAGLTVRTMWTEAGRWFGQLVV
jgi:SAM-dependent methyltransferase